MRLLKHLLQIIPSLFIVLTQSCTLIPSYETPNVEIPDSWRISTDEASTYANYRWWEQLNDPILDCLIAEALANNNDLKVAIARVDKFAANLAIVQSALYPQVGGSLEALRQESSLALLPITLGVPRTNNNFFALINATLNLDLWGQIRSANEVALAQLLGSIETRRTVVMTLITSVASTYIQLRQYDAQLEISRKTFQSFRESYDLAEKRFKGGLTSELEPKQSEAQMNAAAGQVIQYEVAVAQTENLLSVLIGHPPQAIARGQSLDSLNEPPCVPAGIPSEILVQRPDILVAEQNLIAANAQIGVARAQFFPNITLTGTYGNASLELDNLFSAPGRTWQFGATLFQPIFTGGRLIGQLDAAEAQKWEAYYAYQQTVLTAFQEVDDALIAHEKAHEYLVVQNKRSAALQDALHLAFLQYDNGQVDYLNVLDAQRNLFSAQLDQADAKSDIFISMISLYKALGGGWVVDADAQAMGECTCNL